MLHSICLVDGSYLLHKSLSMSNKLSHENRNESEVDRDQFGISIFLSSLARLARGNATAFIVCFDSGIPLFRREIHKDYKPFKRPIGINLDGKFLSNTNISPDELNHDLKSKLHIYNKSVDFLHNQFLRLTNTLSIRAPNVEADDIIAFMTKLFKTEDMPIQILSSDKDLYQLIDDDVLITNGQVSKLVKYDLESFLSSHSLEGSIDYRAEYILRKAITGDVADNIDGVTGAGKLIPSVVARYMMTNTPRTEWVRPARSRIETWNKIIAGDYEDLIARNVKLIDLEYPYRKVPSMITDIRRGVLINAEVREYDSVESDRLIARLGLSSKLQRLSRDISRSNLATEFTLSEIINKCRLGS